jgi:NAD(P)H-hydrate epimerase
MNLVTAAEMRALDRHTIDVLGVPGAVLMESAGRRVADCVEQLLGGSWSAAGASGRSLRIVVVAGTGNNGGDGCVVARTLAGRGHSVELLLIGDEARVVGDARLHLEAAQRVGVPLRVPSHGGSLDAALAGAALVVDALFGTGLSRPLEGLALEAVRAIGRARTHGARIVAVDVPSGLDADRGIPLGAAVVADHTVTFGWAKVGLVTAPGFTFAGELHVAEIGIPQGLVGTGARRRLLDSGCLAPLGGRSPLGHKGTHGHLLLVAGSRGKSGAALLTGRAALRGGAGLVTLATPRALCERFEGALPELLLAPLDADDDPAPLLVDKRAVAVGPGIETSSAARGALGRLLRAAAAARARLVLDADALNHLAADASLLEGVRGQVELVVTPHPKEAARLLGCDVAQIESDRVGAAESLAAQVGGVALLKGARTVVASVDGRVAINPTGNVGLGIGGTGDVLTGLVGALLLDRSLGAFEAVCAAAYLHGAAGDDLVSERGVRGLLASELADRLPLSLEVRSGPRAD